MLPIGAQGVPFGINDARLPVGKEEEDYLSIAGSESFGRRHVWGSASVQYKHSDIRSAFIGGLIMPI